jgi:hypothetical protein
MQNTYAGAKESLPQEKKVGLSTMRQSENADSKKGIG